MNKHAFDPVSFLFGMLFAALGVYLATGTTDLSAFEDERIWPLFLIVAGLLFVGPALSRRGRRRIALDESSASSDETASDGEAGPDEGRAEVASEGGASSSAEAPDTLDGSDEEPARPQAPAGSEGPPSKPL